MDKNLFDRVNRGAPVMGAVNTRMSCLRVCTCTKDSTVDVSAHVDNRRIDYIGKSGGRRYTLSTELGFASETVRRRIHLRGVATKQP